MIHPDTNALEHLQAITEALEAAKERLGLIDLAPDHAAKFGGEAMVGIEQALKLLPSLVEIFCGTHMRYKDRPVGFVEARKKICTSPEICFEFSDTAPLCGPCDRQTLAALTEKPPMVRERK